MRRLLKLIGFVAIIAIFATAAYAFTAQNTQPASTDAGVGVSTVAGYTVTNIKYHMSTNQPGTLYYVQFDLDKSANEVYAWFTQDNTQSTYSTTCSNPQANTWSCYPASGVVDVLHLTGLSIYASQ